MELSREMEYKECIFCHIDLTDEPEQDVYKLANCDETVAMVCHDCHKERLLLSKD